MALSKQLVAFPTDKGLDTKLDIKQEEFGYLRAAENVVYETIKLLRKRNGYDQIDLYDTLNNQILNPKVLARLKDELVLLTEDALYAYSETLQKFSIRGTIFPTTTKTDVIIKNAYSQSQVDAIYAEGLRICSWFDSVHGVRYSVQDLDTNSYLVADGEVSTTGERPVLAQIQNYVYIIYGNGANVEFRRFAVFNPAVLSAPTIVATNRDTNYGLIDAESCDTKVAVAYNSTVVGANLQLFTIAQDATVSSILGVTGASAPNCLDITCDSLSRFIITFSDGTDLQYCIYPFTLAAALLVPTVIETIVDVTTCCTIESGTGTYRTYYEIYQAGPANNYVKQADLTLAGSVTGVTVFMRSVGLAARSFYREDALMVPIVHDSELQATYFLAHENGTIITKWSNQTASGPVDYGVLQQVTDLGDDRFFSAFMFKNRLQSDNGTFFSTDGVQSTLINFSPVSCYSNAELAGSLHFCAGVLKQYDGATVSEHGFYVFPEELLNDSTATTGGDMSDGSYGYVAVYKWTDNTGKDHRSAPTQTVLEVTLSGGTTTQTQTVTVPTLRLTDKDNVVIEIYRTEDAGTTFHKVTSDLSPIINDKTVDLINFVDTLSDAQLISKELLYTTGGVLENIAAPACNQVTVVGNTRLAVISDNSTRVNFSKQVSEGFPVEFTDLIYRDVDPSGGTLNALKSMDEKVILFSKDATFWMGGEGPNNSGQQDTFTNPEIISTDIGCTQPESMVLTPNGLMFKSRKGIWNLNRGLSLEYIGARVEKYNPQVIKGSAIVGELNQVRFILENDRALVYNYNLDRWATFENHGGLSCISVLNDFYYLREDGALYKENRTLFSDASSPIKLKLETGWMSLTELQGIMRVYHAMILCSYKSSHKLRIKVAYDFVDAWVQEVTVDPLNFLDGTTYGEVSPYGADPVYGGDANLYQARIDFQRQKCTAIKLSIEDLQEDVGQALSLSGITLRVGAKEGTNKLAATNKFGTS